MILSLDTNVFIDLLRGRNQAVRAGFNAARMEAVEFRLSLIVWHGLMYGVRRSPRPERALQSVRAVTADIPVEAFVEDDMMAAAEIRARLKSTGQPIGPYDALIAGQALARGWAVVTANRGEFGRVPGLTVIDWTEAA